MQGKHGWATAKSVHFQWNGPSSYYYNQDFGTARVPNTWELLTDQLDPVNDEYGNLARLADDLATGRVEVSASYDGYPYFLSALRLVVITAGASFLWNAQRTGGGGRSAGRGRGNTTQQGSCLNRGGIH